jgi:hypothetical protein
MGDPPRQPDFNKWLGYNNNNKLTLTIWTQFITNIDEVKHRRKYIHKRIKEFDLKTNKKK